MCPGVDWVLLPVLARLPAAAAGRPAETHCSGAASVVTTELICAIPLLRPAKILHMAVPGFRGSAAVPHGFRTVSSSRSVL